LAISGTYGWVVTGPPVDKGILRFSSLPLSAIAISLSIDLVAGGWFDLAAKVRPDLWTEQAPSRL
jgi:hypothetical protein